MLFEMFIDLRSLASVAVDLELVEVGLQHTVEVLIQGGAQICPAAGAVLVVQ